MNKEDIDKLLDEIKPDIKESIKKELLKDITWDVKQTAISQISECIKEFVKDEIIPEVKKDLIENKDSLVSIGKKAGPMVTEEISKAMCLQLAEKLKDSWGRKDLLSGLFK